MENKPQTIETPDCILTVRKTCSKCEKPKVRAKGMCKLCYQKMYRNTEVGKAKMIAYNLTKGKEAQRKFRERKKANKPPKPPKPPKVNCECGKVSVIKNYCTNCYYRLYQRKRGGWKEGTRKGEINIDDWYNKVLTLVKKGYTILGACKILGQKSSSYFYKLITPAQKKELFAYRCIGIVDDDDF